jgi:sirohydrochlorin cobaltochelatase
MGAFGEVVTVFLDQEPNMRDVLALTTCETVVIVPLFIADGWHVGETIPEDLALDGPETRREGRRVRYAGAVGTHPSVVDVILELANARTAGGRDGDRGVRAYPSPVEAVPEGCSVRFGQFEVHREAGSFSLGPAGHDRLGNGEEIAVDDVADRCRSDDLGRYRPLASALTMPTGWYARFKDRAQAGEALDDAYPLARLHCLEWIEGTLRVVGVDEVLSRQSGRYANAGRLSPSGREAARRVLCDERCDLSPVWAEEAEVNQREAPQERVSRGEVPCPEPCSVFVSLCREAELWEHDPPEPAPVDERIAWAAFDEPGNEVREAYLQRRFGDRVTSDE